MTVPYVAASWAKEARLPSWDRTNFAGETVSLTGGLSAAIGAAISARTSVSGLLAVGAASVAGYIDDHLEKDSSIKGLAGHLHALRQGTVTTGALKIALIGGGALLAMRKPYLASAVTIAGTANLINLLDLRPGRALKAAGGLAACVLVTAPGSESSKLAWGALGTVAACSEDDLAGRTMLGDLGANALGALVGLSLARHPVPGVAKAAAVGSTVLILASEKVSFSKVIESTPWLNRIDRWGRD